MNSGGFARVTTQRHESSIMFILILSDRAPITSASYKKYINKLLLYSAEKNFDQYTANYKEEMTFLAKFISQRKL